MSGDARHSFAAIVGRPLYGGEHFVIDAEKDALHVAAILRRGGYPTGNGTLWNGPDGRPWRFKR